MEIPSLLVPIPFSQETILPLRSKISLSSVKYLLFWITSVFVGSLPKFAREYHCCRGVILRWTNLDAFISIILTLEVYLGPNNELKRTRIKLKNGLAGCQPRPFKALVGCMKSTSEISTLHKLTFDALFGKMGSTPAIIHDWIPRLWTVVKLALLARFRCASTF